MRNILVFNNRGQKLHVSSQHAKVWLFAKRLLNWTYQFELLALDEQPHTTLRFLVRSIIWSVVVPRLGERNNPGDRCPSHIELQNCSWRGKPTSARIHKNKDWRWTVFFKLVVRNRHREGNGRPFALVRATLQAASQVSGGNAPSRTTQAAIPTKSVKETRAWRGRNYWGAIILPYWHPDPSFSWRHFESLNWYEPNRQCDSCEGSTLGRHAQHNGRRHPRAVWVQSSESDGGPGLGGRLPKFRGDFRQGLKRVSWTAVGRNTLVCCQWDRLKHRKSLGFSQRPEPLQGRLWGSSHQGFDSDWSDDKSRKTICSHSLIE